MLESNPSDSPAAVKRYAPPSQRRSLNRRRSAEKFEKVNYPHGIEGEKGQESYSRNFPLIDHGVAASNKNIPLETARPMLIPLSGCSNSEASQLLNERWAAAMNLCNDPSIDLSEKPIMYSGVGGSSWGPLKLPHQMDFLGELRRAVQNSPVNAMPPGDHI